MRACLPLFPVVLVGCPPPEVLYGPEIFETVESDASVPGLSMSSEPLGRGRLKRLERPFPSEVGPPPEAVEQEDHIRLSGTIVCNHCMDPLVLHVVGTGDRFTAPPRNALVGGPGRVPLVSAQVTPGDFSVPVPKSDEVLALELVVDRNRDSVASVGERYLEVINAERPIHASSDHTGLTLDVSDRPIGRDRRVQRP